MNRKDIKVGQEYAMLYWAPGRGGASTAQLLRSDRVKVVGLEGGVQVRVYPNHDSRRPRSTVETVEAKRIVAEWEWVEQIKASRNDGLKGAQNAREVLMGILPASFFDAGSEDDEDGEYQSPGLLAHKFTATRYADGSGDDTDTLHIADLAEIVQAAYTAGQVSRTR